MIQLAATAADDGAGDEEAEADGVGAGLEGLEEAGGIGDAGAVIGEAEVDPFAVLGGLQVEGGLGQTLENAEAVASEVEEDLEEAVAVAVGEREDGGRLDIEGDSGGFDGGIHDDAELFEELGDGEGADFGLGGGLEFVGGEAGEALDEHLHGLIVFRAGDGGEAAEVGVGDVDGGAHVADFVGDGADQDAGAAEESFEAGLLPVAEFV
jgi:hypothetical protein